MFFALMTTAIPASASTPLAGWLPNCGCEPRAELAALRQEIASAGDLEEARNLALEPARTAHGIVHRARWIAPGSDALARAHETLDAYERDVADAATREQVAGHYAHLVRLDRETLGSTSGFMEHCSYTTGEIIAIVLGFILGIIPGIILLILLC
jgi:hypothetical protein